MPEVTASDGARLHYEVFGNGPSEVLLLHGMGVSSTSWQPMLNLLDLTALRLVTMDFRGHGRSKGGEAGFNYPQLTADIWTVADAAGLRRPVIVGLSGSGKNAVCATLAAPTRVRGLMLVAPSGMGEVPLPRETMRWFFDHIGREKSIPPEFDPWFTEKIGPHRATVAREYSETARSVLDASAELWVHTSVADQASQIIHPVLVIAGAKEPLYHPDFQRQTTLVSMPQARMEILDCAHFMAFEEPAALASSLTRFCATLP